MGKPGCRVSDDCIRQCERGHVVGYQCCIDGKAGVGYHAVLMGKACRVCAVVVVC